MDKVIELAKEVGLMEPIPFAPGSLKEQKLKRFYALARADLEAECERRKTQFASAEFAVNELKAENAKLKAENTELWKDRETPLKDAALFMSECNRLERERDAAIAENAKLQLRNQELANALGEAIDELDWLPTSNTHDDLWKRQQIALSAARAALGETK